MTSFDEAVANLRRWSADGPDCPHVDRAAPVPQLPVPARLEPSTVGVALASAATSAAVTGGVFALAITLATVLLPGPSRPSVQERLARPAPSLAAADPSPNVLTQTVTNHDGIGGSNGRNGRAALVAASVP
jgi:hypothetical protein